MINMSGPWKCYEIRTIIQMAQPTHTLGGGGYEILGGEGGQLKIHLHKY